MNKYNEVLSKIRKEQRDCSVFIEKYLQDDKANGAALVKMPTGAGKTGVIAIVSTYLRDDRKICIVTPNEGLLNQIENEITAKFWNNIGSPYDEDISIGIVRNKQLVEGTYKSFDIVITTTASLAKLHKNKNLSYYDEFKKFVDLLIFDEAHKEPAEEWSKAIRDMEKKVILFTATPFRNDNKRFEIEDDYSFKISTKEYLGKYLKRVEFKEIKTPNKGVESELINLVSKGKNGEIIVVYAKGKDKIQNIVMEMNKIVPNIAVGFHTKLDNKNDCYSKYCESKLTTESRVIVQQNMLKEGINIPDISSIYFLDDIENIRDVIQLIGRALRKKSKIEVDAVAEIYISYNKFELYKKQWELFLLYDDARGYRVNNKLVDIGDELYSQDIVYDNIKRQFINVLTLEKVSENWCGFKLFDNLMISKSAYIYALKRSINNKIFSKMFTRILKEYKANIQYEILHYELDEKGRKFSFAYKKKRLSDIFKNTSFEENTYEYCIVNIVNGLLFFNDSNRGTLSLDFIREYLEEIDIYSFIKVIPDNILSINNVNLKSASISRNGIYSREFHGENLENTNSSIIERNSICSNVRFQLNDSKKTRRYIGVTTNRVSEKLQVDINKYLEWCCEIECLISKSGKPNNYMYRYALPAKYSPNLKPTSILIDMHDLIEDNSVSDEISIRESISSDIEENNKFEICIDDINYPAKLYLKEDIKTPKWLLKSQILKEIKYNEVKSIEEVINQDKRIRLMFEDSSIVYMDGKYFEPNINFASFKNIESLDIDINGIEDLEGLENEKRGKCKTSSENFVWPDDSVFGVFIKNHEKEFDYIMCDDMGDEIADFICIDTNSKKVVFVHCKHGTSKSSAAAFQDVCGQAMKNLTYVNKLSAINLKGDNKIHSWSEPWKLTYSKENKKEGKPEVKFTCDRFRKKKSKYDDSKVFWDMFKKIMNQSESSVEVWLYTSGMSKATFSDNLGNQKSNHKIAYTKQLIWILLSTKEVISQTGALLKIYCRK